MTWHMGAVAIWFSIAQVILLTYVCLGTGAWFRRLQVQTVPDLALGFMRGRADDSHARAWL